MNHSTKVISTLSFEKSKFQMLSFEKRYPKRNLKIQKGSLDKSKYPVMQIVSYFGGILVAKAIKKRIIG